MVTDVSFRLLGDEWRALRTLDREAKSAFTFVSERGAPLHLALAGTGIASAAIELHRGSWRRQPVER